MANWTTQPAALSVMPRNKIHTALKEVIRAVQFRLRDWQNAWPTFTPAVSGPCVDADLNKPFPYDYSDHWFGDIRYYINVLSGYDGPMGGEHNFGAMAAGLKWWYVDPDNPSTKWTPTTIRTSALGQADWTTVTDMPMLDAIETFLKESMLVLEKLTMVKLEMSTISALETPFDMHTGHEWAASGMSLENTHGMLPDNICEYGPHNCDHYASNNVDSPNENFYAIKTFFWKWPATLKRTYHDYSSSESPHMVWCKSSSLGAGVGNQVIDVYMGPVFWGPTFVAADDHRPTGGTKVDSFDCDSCQAEPLYDTDDMSFSTSYLPSGATSTCCYARPNSYGYEIDGVADDSIEKFGMTEDEVWDDMYIYYDLASAYDPTG